MNFYYRKETDKSKKQPNKYIIPSSGKAIRILKKGRLKDKRVIRKGVIYNQRRLHGGGAISSQI